MTFYDKQKEIIRSVWENDRTIVPAGHMLGKDFVTGFICLAFYLTRHPCRIVTTSVDGRQLQGVLWGEIRRFIQSSRVALDSERGGPLLINHMHIRKVFRGETDGLSYLIGRVAERGEGLSGHHIAKTGDGIPRTLFVADECSGVDQTSLSKGSEWANRELFIGNPYECANDFKWGVKGKPGERSKDPGGDIRRTEGDGYLRRVIKIRAVDSPNVRLGLAQKAAGKKPTDEILVPGVLSYYDYLKRRATWDAAKQCSGLDAEFFEGADVLMFPPLWLNRAEQIALGLRGRKRRAEAVGIDPGEGSSNTAMTAIDRFGVIEQVSRKTPNTDDIPREAIAFWEKHGCDPANVVFDRGGGGKMHADRLRSMGYPVRTVGFGEPVSPEPRRGYVDLGQVKEEREQRTVYVNRRAQMYGALRELLDPANMGFGIPESCVELRRQLAPIPLLYDEKGRFKLLPKSGPKESKTLIGILGCSPDEADSLVLAVYGMQNGGDAVELEAFAV